MVAMSKIEKFSRRIGRNFNAERVILFGSYADGSATENSDVDLLIVADVPASFDIIVKTPAEYFRLRSIVNNIAYFAEKYGKVLYER